MGTEWVAVGLSRDLPAGVAMPASWQGRELAVWRSASGKLSAWNDRCPHRGMRLSHGFVRGETLACIYHGWVYGTSGSCSHIPAHPDLVPPATIKAETFLCVEVGGVIWVGAADATDSPPEFTGFAPVRSVATTASAAELAATSGLALTKGTLAGTIAAGPVCLILSPSHSKTGIHALAAAGVDPVAVSRWLDGVVRRAEERVPA